MAACRVHDRLMSKITAQHAACTLTGHRCSCGPRSAPAGGAAEVGVHAGVAHGAPEHVRPLVVLHVLAAQRVPPPRGCTKPCCHQLWPASCQLRPLDTPRGLCSMSQHRTLGSLMGAQGQPRKLGTAPVAGATSRRGRQRSPRPRSTRKRRFSWAEPAGPMRKFSGFTSPCTYLQAYMVSPVPRQAQLWNGS